MSDDDKILSKEEVDALLDASKDNTGGATPLNAEAETSESWPDKECPINEKILNNLTQFTTAECEKILLSFLKKKISVTFKASNTAKLAECLEGKADKKVFSIYEIKPNMRYGMVVLELNLLDLAVNLLYGGSATKADNIMESPGKIGLIIAEKISQMCLEGFIKSCREYGDVQGQVIKTMTQPNLSSKLGMEDSVYAIEMTLVFGEVESTITLIVMYEFLKEFISEQPSETKGVESNFWRSAIETQVADSHVMIQVVLPDVQVKLNDLMAMENGALIPISDPTLVYVCLNNLKLFRANAGQANSKRVARILSEV